MHISRLFTFASLTLGFASALAIPVRCDTTRDDDLARRDNHANYDKVSFTDKSMRHMQNILGLKDHDGKVVEDYHKNIVAAEMEKHGAHSAEINYLAHTQGSTDPNMHITATFRDAEGTIVHSTYGTPAKIGDRHHVYTGELPKEYTQAVQRHKEHLDKNPEEKAKHEARLAQTKAGKEATDRAIHEKNQARKDVFEAKNSVASAVGAAKQKELSGDAEAHAANRKAHKEAKKAKKHPKK